MPSETTNVFVSYSHADASLVSPVVKLLRVNKSLVFQDTDAIQPGKRWQGEIAKALAESHLVVVFWCTHASRSNEVSREWQAAIEQKKDLLPLLLDTTPLPTELAEFQWIDFRGTVGASHSSLNLSDNAIEGRAPPLPSGAPRKSARWLLPTAAAAFLGIVVLLGLVFLTKSHVYAPSGGPTATYTSPIPTPIYTYPLPAPAPPAPHRVPAPAPAQSRTLLYLCIGFAVTVYLIWLLRRPRKRGIRMEGLERPPGNIERQIASQLESEILRRTTLRQDGGT
jgi:TIR domain-containing protein